MSKVYYILYFLVIGTRNLQDSWKLVYKKKKKNILVHETEGQSTFWKCFMNWKSFSEVFHYNPIKHYMLEEFYPFKVGNASFAKK